MEEYLDTIESWLVRGSLKQFQTMISSHLETDGYAIEHNDGVLLFYRTHQEGGFLGIGRKTVKAPVMQIIKGEDGVHIAREPLDREFAHYLANYLSQLSSRY